MSKINIAEELSKVMNNKPHNTNDQMENVQMQIRHSTLVRVAQRHYITKEANNKIIDDAINYYLDNIN